jgi:hypothetical protein
MWQHYLHIVGFWYDTANITARTMTETKGKSKIDVTSNPIETSSKKKKHVTKKKMMMNFQPLIFMHVPLYSIVDDIKNQQARITFRQLLELAPKCHSELAYGIRKPTLRKMNLGEQEIDETATTLYCDATIKGTELPLIVNSRAAKSIVSCQLLKDLKIPIDRPSTTMMINVNGEQKRSLGEVLNFLITIKGFTVPINVIIAEADSYRAIVGNDWLEKVKANINYEISIITITWEGKMVDIPIEYHLLSREKWEL